MEELSRDVLRHADGSYTISHGDQSIELPPGATVEEVDAACVALWGDTMQKLARAAQRFIGMFGDSPPPAPPRRLT